MKSEKKYSAIVFDLGNVLVPFDYSVTINKINKVKPGLGEKFMEYYKSHYDFHRNFERGLISENEFLNKMLKILDNALDRETFCIYYSDIFIEDKNVTALLPVLKKDYKLFLLSNTDPVHKKYGWEKCKFLEYFDNLMLSFEAGAVKPEEKIYGAVEAASGFQPKEHLYIDDILDYVQAAQALGWDAIHFKNYEQLIIDFTNKGVLNLTVSD